MKISIDNYLNTRGPRNGRFYAVAVDGRGGAGKTNLTEYLKDLLPGFTFLSFDDYFEPKAGSEAWGYLNKARFNQDVIKPLQENIEFKYRPYNWHAVPHITERVIKIEKGLCLEGCFSFSFDLDWDLKIWVEASKEVCLKRGLAREHMPKDRIVKAWQIWQQQEDKYIARIKPLESSNIVVDGVKPFEEQLL